MLCLKEVVNTESLALSRAAKYLEIANAVGVCGLRPSEMADTFLKADLACFCGKYGIAIDPNAIELDIASAIWDAFYPQFNSDLC